MIYDYVIIGAGPTGLTLAYLLGKLGHKCVIIDKNDSIGGCHRVTRVNGLFTEHGPRIYSSTYINTMKLLQKMNVDFYDLFTPYNFKISNIGGKTIVNFSSRELLILIGEFFKLIINTNHGRTISMKQFMNQHSFSQKSMDYIDRLCRLTDGAGIDRYSLFEFLQLANQQAFYRLYQPKKPNDVGLFYYFLKALKETKNVTILLETSVLELNSSKNTREIINVRTNKGVINGKNFILAVSPKDMLSILNRSGYVISKTFGELDHWTKYSTYINDIPIIFHWNRKLELPKIWGFPASDWGIAFIVLSDYMNFDDNRSQTVITTCITDVNKVSHFLKMTANQVTTKKMLINEVFRQLKQTYPYLPNPTFSFLSPTVYRSKNEWIDKDSAYVMTNLNKFLPSSGKIPNLYNVGTQNGKSLYNFTSFESAVTNAIAFVNEKYPNHTSQITLTKPFSIHIFIFVFIFVIFVIFVIVIIIISSKLGDKFANIFRKYYTNIINNMYLKYRS